MSLWMISITTLSRGRLRNQCDSGEERGGNDRFDVYSARLPPHLLELRRLGDGLRSLIHVAQTAQVAAPAAEKPKRIRTPRRKKTEETES